MITLGKKPIKFQFKKEFKDDLKSRKVEWGYGGLSAFTYYRTYARKKDNGKLESWADCVIRVIEGMFSILKTHSITSEHTWRERRAHRLAEECAERLFEFKWTPPGRGLWMMGTDFVWEKGGSALNNPLSPDTEILTKEYGWIALGDIPSTEVTILSKLRNSSGQFTGGTGWFTATITPREKHTVYKISYETKFGNNYEVVSSENHRWFRKSTTKKAFERVDTSKLKAGDYLPRSKPALTLDLSLVGAAHGYFFGDGTRSNGELHQFTDENKKLLKTLFADDYFRESNRVLESGLTELVVKNLPIAWSKLPQGDYRKDHRYIYGFLAGYFAADGRISDYTIHSARKQELEEVSQLFWELGIETSQVILDSESSNFSDTRKLYKLKLNRYDLPEKFFIREDHIEKSKTRKAPKYDYHKITNIVKLNEPQEVMCLNTPAHENFTIQGFTATSNCGFVSTQNIDAEMSKPFAFLMDMSMVGVGVGFDTKGAGKIASHIPQGDPEVILVEDSREGWVELISCVIDSYLEEGSNPVVPDTSLVRGYGEPIKGFGGVASGPEPLIQGFWAIVDILEKRARSDNPLLTSVDITDIMNIIGKIVVAGNVRRTAEIAFSEPEDEAFADMKNWSKFAVETGSKAPQELQTINEDDYNEYNSCLAESDETKIAKAFKRINEIANKYAKERWAYKFGGWRWASNNSIFASVGMDYSKYEDNIASSGEPGFAWLENMQAYSRMKDAPDHKDHRVRGGNPCLEQSLEPYELCCLVETFPNKHSDYWDFQRTLKFAYLYAKAVTLIPTHWRETNDVIKRNRRIGASQSGIQEAILKFGRRRYLTEFCDQAYDYIKYLDKKYSEWLGVPLSIKSTSVKPSGTVSLVAGSLPGIHYAEAESYYRLIRVANTSNLLPILEAANYRIEPAVSDPTKTSVIYFPVVHEKGIVAKTEVSIWEQFANAADLQEYWADNQVSITITFKPEEKNQIARALSCFDRKLKGVSLLPLRGHGYTQAPYTPAKRVEVENYESTLLPLDFSSLTEEGENAESNKFCDSSGCEI